MGRIGYFLRISRPPQQRDLLAHDLLFLSRGQPIVYYGDEQGFAGVIDGADKDARQSLFASQVDEYENQTLITGETVGSVDRFDTDAPLYEHIAALSQLREAHPALVDGAQVELLRRAMTPASTRSPASTATSASSTSWPSTTPRPSRPST